MGDDEFERAVSEAVEMAEAEHKLAALVRLRQSVLAERRLLRVLTVVAIIVGCVGIFLSVGARYTADKAQDALAEIQASRADARLVSCISYNEDVVDRVNGILITAGARSDNPDAHDRVEQLLLPHRDCSAQGIADYFDGDRATDPFVPVTLPEED